MSYHQGIELYDSNAQHAASYISISTLVLDKLADEIESEAKNAAEPYRKSLTDSYVDHFRTERSLYTGPQKYPTYPVYDRLVLNDHYAAHIVELGIGKDVINFSDGRQQRVTENQRGHFFLVGAAAKAIAASSFFRPPPALRRANWDKNKAANEVNSGTGFRHSTAAGG